MLEEAKSVQQGGGNANLLKESFYSLETIIALQRLLADGIPDGSDNELSGNPERSNTSEAPRGKSPSPLISLWETIKCNANGLASSVARYLAPVSEPLSKTSDRNRSAQRAG